MTSGLELVLPDEATLLPLTAGLRLGWVEAPVPVRWASAAEVEAAAVTSDDRAGVAAGLRAAGGDARRHRRCRGRQEPRGPVALATERRPDELGEIEIDARDASPAAEALASILRGLHFGAGGLVANDARRRDPARRRAWSRATRRCRC